MLQYDQPAHDSPTPAIAHEPAVLDEQSLLGNAGIQDQLLAGQAIGEPTADATELDVQRRQAAHALQRLMHYGETAFDSAGRVLTAAPARPPLSRRAFAAIKDMAVDGLASAAKGAAIGMIVVAPEAAAAAVIGAKIAELCIGNATAHFAGQIKSILDLGGDRMDDEDILTYVDYAKLSAIGTCYDLIDWVDTVEDPEVLQALVQAGTAPPQAYYEAQIANTILAFSDYAAIAASEESIGTEPQPHDDHVVHVEVAFDRAAGVMTFAGATIADGVVSERQLAYLERAAFADINVQLDIQMDGQSARDQDDLDPQLLEAYEAIGSRVYGELLFPASGGASYEKRRFWQLFGRILGFDVGGETTAGAGIDGMRNKLLAAGSLSNLGVPLVTRGAKIGPFEEAA